MRTILAAALALLMTALPRAGEAAIVNYTYQGQELHCVDDASSYCYSGPVTAGFTGRIVIDTDQLPGQQLVRTTIYLTWETIYEWNRRIVGSYSVSNEHGALTGTFSYLVSEDPILNVPGLLFADVGGVTPTYTVGNGDLKVIFGWDGHIRNWGGSNMIGGSDDPSTGNFGDGTMFYRSAGPGIWSMDGVPAPIPIPATGYLLAACIGLLALGRRITRSAAGPTR